MQNSSKMKKAVNIDRKLSFFICGYILLNNLNSTLQTAFGVNGLLLVQIKTLIQVCLLLILVRSINHMKLSTFSVFVISEVFAIILCGYSLLVGASFQEISIWSFSLITTCIPLFAATYSITDKSILYEMMVKTSGPLLCILVISFLFSRAEYDMHFSYSLVFVLLIHINEFLTKKKKAYLFLSVIELLMISLHGSRGGLLCLGFYLVLKVLSIRTSLKKRVSILISVSIAIIILYALWNNNKSTIFNFLISKGISSRTLLFLMSGGFLTNHTGRDNIWRATTDLIKQKPLFGWGIGGAANSISELSFQRDKYPHQIFLDYLLTFGCIWGSIFSVITCVEAIKMLFVKGKNRDLCYIFLSIGFIGLLFTGTVFSYFYFYIFAGLAFSTNAMYSNNLNKRYGHNSL